MRLQQLLDVSFASPPPSGAHKSARDASPSPSLFALNPTIRRAVSLWSPDAAAGPATDSAASAASATAIVGRLWSILEDELHARQSAIRSERKQRRHQSGAHIHALRAETGRLRHELFSHCQAATLSAATAMAWTPVVQ
jgi:hypothetical protein